MQGSVFTEKSRDIIEAGRFLYGQGWNPATSGNYSARLDAEYAALTASGKHKGKLKPADILVVDMAGQPRDPSTTPSAETLLHTTVYRMRPEVGAVLHTHSVNGTVLSLLEPGSLVIQGYEMLKAIAGIKTHETSYTLPNFPNTQDMTALSQDLEAELEKREDLVGFLIAGHGLYAWGRDMAEAKRHIEAFEFLFACELQMRRLKA